MSLSARARMYGRFAWHLRRFVRTPLSLEQSRAIIAERLRSRAQNLLTVIKTGIYKNPNSPYLGLLELAGCEYGDIEAMVLKDGVEASLDRIRREGVYLSVEEFKGKKELERGGRIFRFEESDFDNPVVSAHLAGSSSATRSRGTRTTYDLDYLAMGRAVYNICLLQALDSLHAPHGLWGPIMPGFGPLEVLAFAKVGKSPARWFSPVESRSIKPSLKSRVGTNYLVWAGKVLGARFPSPEYVPPDEAGRVARWIADQVGRWGGCTLDTYTSNAVRISRAAREDGLDLGGADLLPAGEPLTAAKRREIEASGARACTRFIFSEGGYVGFGCLNPTAPDDSHFLRDGLALIQHDRHVPHADVSVEAFLFTTLLPCAPKILLNVESGDYGVVERRSCGCGLEELGFTDHISHVRGFDRLTSEGMTFVGTDFVRIMEEVLPARFGGGTIDYQMVEEEDAQGTTNMSLFVSPELGEVDEDRLVRTVLAELAEGNDSQRMMARVWADADTLKVRRERPLTTARGKLLPLHIHRGECGMMNDE